MSYAKIPAFGVNVVGHVSGNLGLGVLARHVVSLLLSRGCAVRILDVDPRMGRGGQDKRFAEYTVASVDGLIYPVTILIFPPISIVEFLRDGRNSHLLWRGDGLNVALINWEQMVVPREWVSVLAGLDVIVAPSAFTRETFERGLPDVPVISMKVPLWLPKVVREDRGRFGLQLDWVWFGSSFEPQSDPTRKNPFAVLDAFERAFPGRRNVGLMIKVNNALVDGSTHPVVEELRARIRKDRRVVLFEQSLDYEGVLSLYASLDVFVSLHRSEGIGLGLMEAMALGKPLIATGWSGNMSFMDRSSACVVAYELVPVRSSTYVYAKMVLGPQAVWAEPDVSNAAEWMSVLADRPDVRATIGRSAREAMKRYQEEAQQGVFLDELWSILKSEISWGIGQERRKARRDCLRRSMVEGELPPAWPAGAWTRRLLSLGKKAGFRRGRFPFWPPARRSKS
jgi:glycosyltransferase involved in cell wall biosynthesis